MANLTNLNNKFLVTTGGNVGINTTSPDSKLDVTGGDITVNTTATGFMNFKYSNSQKGTIGTDGVDLKITANADLQLLPTGNVGIKTSSPGRILTIGNGNGFVNNQISLLDGGGTEQATIAVETTSANDLLVASKASLRFFTGSTIGGTTTLPTDERMRIVSDGNVLIGNSVVNPASGFSNQKGIGYNSTTGQTQIASTSDVATLVLGRNNSTDGSLLEFRKESTVIGNFGSNTTSGEVLLDLKANKNFRVVTNNIERMRITSAGKVGIGTTVPSKQLVLEGDNAEFLINRTGSYADTINMGMPGGVSTIVGGTDLAFGGTGTWTEHMRIKSNGKIGINETAPATLLSLAGLKNESIITLKSTTNDSNWTAGDKIGGINFFSEDGSGSGAGIKGSISYIATSSSGGSTAMTFNTASSATNNIERVRIDASGRVGIGTTSPDFALDIEASGSGVQLQIGRISSNNGSTWMGSDSNGFHLGVGTYGSGNSVSDPNGFTIDTSGNVGIGTGANIDTKFHVEETASNTSCYATIESASWNAGLTLKNGNATWEILNDYTGLGTTGALAFYRGDYHMVIDSGGHVGIGETSPGSYYGDQLVVKAPDENGITIAGTGASQKQYICFADGTSGAALYTGHIAYDHDGDTMAFATNGGALAMYIDSSQRVGIGTTSPDEKLDITGGYLKFNGGDYGLKGSASLTYNAVSDHYFLASGSTKVTIKANGNVGIGTTSPDKRLTVGGVNATEGINLKTKSGSNVWTIWSVEQYFSQEGYMRLFYDNVSRIQFRADGDSFFNGGDVGIGTTSPQTKLDVRGNIVAGDSTTGNTMRRKYQNFSTTKTGPSSGGNIDMIFVDHTHALDITVLAYINTSTVAVARGYSLTAYGAGGGGFTQTQMAPNGTISAISMSYVNSGGSEAYILRVSVTYTGSTAPTITMTANGTSTSKLRAAV